jgi:hypothetical protein
MADLNQNWLTEGWVDFEYKKYLLLAYLQQVVKQFDERKIYPKLSELVTHYNSLQLFKNQKAIVAGAFPKEISRLDFENFKIEYKQYSDDELVNELDNIVEFALPEIERKLGIGKELYEEVESNVEVFPVGILPLRTDEGYFFLSDFMQKAVGVYYYQISIFESASEKYRGINARYLFDYRQNISSTYEEVKCQLLKDNTTLPNPATYAVEYKQSFPLSETMLPVAKRMLVRYISGR